MDAMSLASAAEDAFRQLLLCYILHLLIYVCEDFMLLVVFLVLLSWLSTANLLAAM